ncbi:MAG: hypothetical protein WC989_03185 [Micavibrio sp.]
MIKKLLLCLSALAITLSLPAFAQGDAGPIGGADERPPVDWNRAESAGTLSGIKSGALERTLWRGQKRSSIEFLIAKLPDIQPMRSVLNLQRRLLLTEADASLITNDIGPLRGNDLLIQRIRKLMAMGLYDNAWDLYTQRSEDPYDVSIAQLGMLLLVMKNDLATACLEEKAIARRYPSDAFFKMLDGACNEVLGTGEAPQFPQSPVLQALYHDASYNVSAAAPGTLERMGDLERALLLANGRISYDGLTPALLKTTPSALIGLYLMDGKLPESARALLRAEAESRGMAWHIPAIASDPAWRKARDMGKDKEAQWPLLQESLHRISHPADLAPYIDMLAEAAPPDLSTETLTKALGAFLASARPLPPFWLKAAQQKAAEKPLFYIYLQSFASLTPTRAEPVTSENLKKALAALKPADSDQIIAIIETLDKNAGILNNLDGIYDKHSILTLEGNYVMPSTVLNVMLETAPEQKQLGITVLAVLNTLAASPDNMYSGSVRKALGSMLNVGLIEDAKLIGAEAIASVLSKY